MMYLAIYCSGVDEETVAAVHEIKDDFEWIQSELYEGVVSLKVFNDEHEAHEWLKTQVPEFESDLDEKTYTIVRFYQDSNKEKELIATGLTLEEAQEHCHREDTHGDGWFDGYDEE